MGHLLEQPQGALFSLTPLGRRHLVKETGRWKRLSAAIARILETDAAKG